MSEKPTRANEAIPAIATPAINANTASIQAVPPLSVPSAASAPVPCERCEARGTPGARQPVLAAASGSATAMAAQRERDRVMAEFGIRPDADGFQCHGQRFARLDDAVAAAWRLRA